MSLSLVLCVWILSLGLDFWFEFGFAENQTQTKLQNQTQTLLNQTETACTAFQTFGPKPNLNYPCGGYYNRVRLQQYGLRTGTSILLISE